MRVFNIIIIVVNTLLLLILGSLMVALGLSETAGNLILDAHKWMEAAIQASLSARVILISVGLIFVLTSLYTIFGNIQKRRYERTVVFHNPLGEVMIALGALEDMGKVVRSEVEGLKDIKMRVVARRKGISVTAKVVLWSDANLPKTTELAQESIRRYLHNILGVEQDIRPRIVVSKVVFREPSDERTETLARPRRRF
jgi:hypothetical protein